jgi:hypothetical protein
MRVSTSDLRIAADWLENYEGDGDEVQIACARVAKYLEQLAEAREMDTAVRSQERKLRAIAAESGVDIKVVRKKLRAKLRGE